MIDGSQACMDPERGAASSLMCSYNAVNGIPSCADVETLGKARAMGFEGYITSDCGAVQDVYVRPPHLAEPFA